MVNNNTWTAPLGILCSVSAMFYALKKQTVQNEFKDNKFMWTMRTKNTFPTFKVVHLVDYIRYSLKQTGGYVEETSTMTAWVSYTINRFH